MKELIYRKDRIIQLCTNKSVLHLGFIQHGNLFEKLISKGEWLHEMIADVALSLVGVDYLEEEVKVIQEKYHYECYCADVAKPDALPELEDKFDVIVCGELIEHLENPGLMLDFCRRFMHSNTILIITTPNPWSKERIRLTKKDITEKTWLNSEHTCWFTYQTLTQLLNRKGFIDGCYTYYADERAIAKLKYQNQILNLISRQFRQIRLRRTPRQMQDGLFFVAKLKNDAK